MPLSRLDWISPRQRRNIEEAYALLDKFDEQCRYVTLFRLSEWEESTDALLRQG